MAVTPLSVYEPGRTDFISKLPVEILITILSFLGMEEAIRTSVLSRRWRDMWTYTRRLSFDDAQLVYDRFPTERVEAKFVHWVNHILESHQGTNIDEFEVCFNVNEGDSKSDIDGWIAFSLRKRVKRLYVDFTTFHKISQQGKYKLTTEFLSIYNLDSLTVLYLNSVEVTGKVVEYILSHCPFLEVLNVTDSNSLLHLKVLGSSLKLKSLEILDCNLLKDIKIAAKHLVSFEYSGPIISISLINTPSLTEIRVGAMFFVKNIYQLSGCLSQLEVLELDFLTVKDIKIFRTLIRLPVLRNLKQLELRLNRLSNIFYCISLLKVFPQLRTLIVEMSRSNSSAIDESEKIKYKFGKMEEHEEKQHKCLKVIEVSGYKGVEGVDAMLLLWLLRRAGSYDDLVIAVEEEESKDAFAIFAKSVLALKVKKIGPKAELVFSTLSNLKELSSIS
ncbi:hypothetical protein SLEP1_g55886 [Rubroshorea leprosula]|uniref:F-box domain-containing protein n=1 Tax=Rubroshorea leprosula TaxID=152421 RepID=A0AAV5MJZ6_9ROSI|nr:hypothetical protein SLEP1_g55886 [Rubroshorea leprosula]